MSDGANLGHDDLADLLGAYVLGAVDPAEALLVDDHLGTCPRCRQEVAELREVAALLANSATPAPDGLWDQIATALSDAPPPLRLQVVPSAPVTELDARRTSRLRRAGVAVVSVAAAVVIALLGVQVAHQHRQIDHLEAQSSQADLAGAANAALAAPGSRVARLRSEDGNVQVAAVVRNDGAGYLFASSLPDPGPSIYQLWGATDSGKVISLGVIHPGLVAFTGNSSIGTLMVTKEVEPVAASTSPAFVIGSLS